MSNINTYWLVLLLTFVSCSEDKKKTSSSTSEQDCPSSVAVSSNLILNPGAQTAQVLHTNGISTSFNWQLKGTLNTSYNVDVYDIDLFDTSASTISTLKASGKKVVCYFSAGSSENWRDDYSQFDTEDLGSELDGWDGERWLDIRSLNVFNIMKDRIDLAVTKGCDAVEPDNMDGYTNDECFNLSASDQLKYNQAIANYARSQGLSVGLKNDPDQVSSLVDYFDFSVSEQCYEYSECSSYLPFVAAGKPVFNTEYDTKYKSGASQTAYCNYSNTNNIQSHVFALDLDDSYSFTCY